MTPSLDKFFFEFDEPPTAPPSTPVPLAPALNTDETRALARIGVALFQWNTAAAGIEAALTAGGQQEAVSRLRVAREEIAEALQEGGIEIDDPSGRTMAEVIDHANVRGWRQQEGAVGETVSQVVAPIIRHRGAVLLRGQVVMTKAPPPAEPFVENPTPPPSGQ